MLYTLDGSRLAPMRLVILLFLAGPSGCVSTAPQDSTSSVERSPLLDVAVSQIGTPYRYGGVTPNGFDCSGLVYYAYRSLGIRVPRSTMAQFRHARPVALKNLEPGNLVFFKQTRYSISHVGIYAGNARFIHAPSKGRVVSYDSLNDPYWRKRLVAAGRYD